MKKWMYIIFPGILLVIFLGLYFSSKKQTEEREAAKAAEAARIQQVEDAKKKEAEEQARLDAEKRQKEQEAETRRKEAEHLKKWQDDYNKVVADRDRYNAQADANNKKASELEIQLDQLRRDKEKDNRDDFDMLKQVEKARVHERNAELEIQRMVEMIARKAGDSTLTRMPPPPPPEK
jgi:type IV secretory pathway VirB10-like protein